MDVKTLVELETRFKSVKRLRSRRGKNSRRNIRRKRSKLRYYRTLRNLRFNRKTDDLCSSVKGFNINDMDCTQTCSFQNLPSEVVEWHKQDQIAYWKSQAISLELENRMLRRHLRNVYAQTIEDYSQQGGKEIKDSIINPDCTEDVIYDKQTEEQEVEDDNGVESNSEKLGNNDKSDKMEANAGKMEASAFLNPNVQLQKRTEEMRKIYGEKASKIMGMEMAIQLNYERHVEQSKPFLWPNIPLRITF